MYQYSLNFFMKLFSQCIDNSEPSERLRKRLKNIMSYTTYFVYVSVCRGLFEKHKLMLSFQMTIKIEDGEGALNVEQLDFFLKGNLSLEKSARAKPHEWWPDQGWEDVVRLTELGASGDAGASGDGGERRGPADRDRSSRA